MSIAPIVQTVKVKADPARAFELFTARIGQWWPHGQGIGAEPLVEVVIEPRVGGRWFERSASGAETQWGEVLAWDPPGRLLLGWKLGTDWRYHPDLLTEVELTFAPGAGGGATVTLEHRNLERFGADAAAHAARLNSGWPARIGDYAAFADAAAPADQPA